MTTSLAHVAAINIDASAQALDKVPTGSFLMMILCAEHPDTSAHVISGRGMNVVQALTYLRPEIREWVKARGGCTATIIFP